MLGVPGPGTAWAATPTTTPHPAGPRHSVRSWAGRGILPGGCACCGACQCCAVALETACLRGARCALAWRTCERRAGGWLGRMDGAAAAGSLLVCWPCQYAVSLYPETVADRLDGCLLPRDERHSPGRLGVRGRARRRVCRSGGVAEPSGIQCLAGEERGGAWGAGVACSAHSRGLAPGRALGRGGLASGDWVRPRLVRWSVGIRLTAWSTSKPSFPNAPAPSLQRLFADVQQHRIDRQRAVLMQLRSEREAAEKAAAATADPVGHAPGAADSETATA